MIQYPLSLLFFLLLSVPSIAQLPSLSPPGQVRQQVGNTVITVAYERPAARGRKVFGALVPFGKVWRTGAGYCTKIAFSASAEVAGQTVAAGKYALLSIPGPEEWTIILNSDTTLYGARDYDSSRDVIRFRVPTTPSGRHFESLSIDLDVVEDNARLYLSWADVQVNFLITTSTTRTALAYIDSLLNAPHSANTDYASPAEFLFYSRGDYNKALRLLDRQLSMEVSESPLRVKFEILEYLGYRSKAMAVIQEIEKFLATEPYDEKNLAWSRAYWKREKARLESANE